MGVGRQTFSVTASTTQVQFIRGGEGLLVAHRRPSPWPSCKFPRYVSTLRSRSGYLLKTNALTFLIDLHAHETKKLRNIIDYKNDASKKFCLEVSISGLNHKINVPRSDFNLDNKEVYEYVLRFSS